MGKKRRKIPSFDTKAGFQRVSVLSLLKGSLGAVDGQNLAPAGMEAFEEQNKPLTDWCEILSIHSINEKGGHIPKLLLGPSFQRTIVLFPVVRFQFRPKRGTLSLIQTHTGTHTHRHTDTHTHTHTHQKQSRKTQKTQTA